MWRAFKCLLARDWSRGFSSALPDFSLVIGVKVHFAPLSRTRHDARATPSNTPTYLPAASVPLSRDAARACLWCEPTRHGKSRKRLRSSRASEDASRRWAAAAARARSVTCKQRHKGERWKRQRGCGVAGKQRPDGTSQRVISPLGASLQLFAVTFTSPPLVRRWFLGGLLPSLWHWRSVSRICALTFRRLPSTNESAKRRGASAFNFKTRFVAVSQVSPLHSDVGG